MPDLTQVVGVVNLVEPLAFAIIAAIRAHHNATGQFPSNAQVLEAVSLDAADIRQMWATWTAAHPPVAPVAPVA